MQWGEIILFNKALNRAQETIVYNYLSAKYNIALTGGSYYNGLTPYNHDLIGIGNGNDGAQAVAKGGGLILNNFGMLNDEGDFFVAAHDNGSGTTSVSGVSGVNYRYNRLWSITKTDAAGTTGGRVGIGFDLTELGNVSSPGTASDYSLLFSVDGVNFSTITPVSASMINTTTIQFTVDASSIADGYYSVGAATLSVLPLQLISFDAKAINGTAVLSWKTLDEMNVDRFEIEHALDGAHFNKIGKLTANNSASKLNYVFTQPYPGAGINYYRLKMVEKNGAINYSETRTLVFESRNSLQVFPSPFRESFTVKLSQGEKIISAELYDVSGRKMVCDQSQENNLVNFHPLNAPAGTYIVKIVTNKRSWNGSIMKVFR